MLLYAIANNEVCIQIHMPSAYSVSYASVWLMLRKERSDCKEILMANGGGETGPLEHHVTARIGFVIQSFCNLYKNCHIMIQRKKKTHAVIEWKISMSV